MSPYWKNATAKKRCGVSTKEPCTSAKDSKRSAQIPYCVRCKGVHEHKCTQMHESTSYIKPQDKWPDRTQKCLSFSENALGSFIYAHAHRNAHACTCAHIQTYARTQKNSVSLFLSFARAFFLSRAHARACARALSLSHTCCLFSPLSRYPPLPLSLTQRDRHFP